MPSSPPDNSMSGLPERPPETCQDLLAGAPTGHTVTSTLTARKGTRRRLVRVAALLRVLVPRELRLRYRTSALDVAWAFITPVVNLAVYGYILTQSFGAEAECAPYVVSAWAGLVLWMFLATSVGTAVSTYLSSSALITKVYFPREALPLAATASSLPDLAIGVATVLALMVGFGVGFSVAGLLAVVPLMVMVLWTAAISVFVSALSVFVRDNVHAVHLALRAGFFATPVVYEASFLPAALSWTSVVNPAAVAITGFRESLLCGVAPNLRLLAVHSALALLALIGSVAYTRSVESRITDLV